MAGIVEANGGLAALMPVGKGYEIEIPPAFGHLDFNATQFFARANAQGLFSLRYSNESINPGSYLNISRKSS